MAVSELDHVKQAARATWAAGDYPAVAARMLWPVGERVVRRIGVAPGEAAIDVACGTGNAAIRAAEAGARVAGVDLTPELLDAGRRLAAEAGVEIEWLEGDAEALPVADGRFDVALSVFGCMFAPRHRCAAEELARVLRPGGRLCVTAWTPEGYMGRFFRTVGGHLPPPPAFVEPPVLWGSEEHVAELFDGTGVELAFSRETLELPSFATVDEEIEFSVTRFGPMIMARRLLEPLGRWDALLADVRELLEDAEPAEYLVTTGRKR